MPACAPVDPDPSEAPPEGFLARQGTQLVLDGKEFREISFDKFDLFHQYVLPREEHQGGDGRPAAEEAMRALGARGFRVVRGNASPFYPAWFEHAFFDDDPQRQAQKREAFFEDFDAMLDQADQCGLRIVATLIWNIENLADLGHHSLAHGIRDPESAGRRRVEEYVRAVVSRYRDRTTIAMWEISNEFNLFADLQAPNGLFDGSPEGDALHPGPVVRDQRNNVTSDDLARFYKKIAELIRSIDRHHLITTGISSPRPSAMHQLRAARRGFPVDWTPDSEAELAEYIEMMHPDPIDAISIHYYDDGMLALGGSLGGLDNLRFFKGVADQIGKPLFMGEIGLHAEIPGYDYRSAEAIALLKRTLPVLVELEVLLTLYWTFSDDRTWNHGDSPFKLRHGETDQALGVIAQANERIAEGG